jgi:hypothetical protein
MLETKEAIAKVEEPYWLIDMNVCTDDPEEKIKEFEGLKAKYTKNCLITSEWWGHPYFDRGNSHWISYVDGEYYDVDYSSHEFERKTEVDGKPKYKIGYTRTLHVHHTTIDFATETIHRCKEKLREKYQEKASITYRIKQDDIKNQYGEQIKKLEEQIKKIESERDGKLREVIDAHYNSPNDKTWEDANAEIQEKLYGKLPTPPKKTTKKSKK